METRWIAWGNKFLSLDTVARFYAYTGTCMREDCTESIWRGFLHIVFILGCTREDCTESVWRQVTSNTKTLFCFYAAAVKTAGDHDVCQHNLKTRGSNSAA